MSGRAIAAGGEARGDGGRHPADVGDGMVRVYLRGVTGPVPRVVDAAEAAGFTVTDLSITELTLETVFISS